MVNERLQRLHTQIQPNRAGPRFAIYPYSRPMLVEENVLNLEVAEFTDPHAPIKEQRHVGPFIPILARFHQRFHLSFIQRVGFPIQLVEGLEAVVDILSSEESAENLEGYRVAAPHPLATLQNEVMHIFRRQRVKGFPKLHGLHEDFEALQVEVACADLNLGALMGSTLELQPLIEGHDGRALIVGEAAPVEDVLVAIVVAKWQSFTSVEGVVAPLHPVPAA